MVAFVYRSIGILKFVNRVFPPSTFRMRVINEDEGIFPFFSSLIKMSGWDRSIPYITIGPV